MEMELEKIAENISKSLCNQIRKKNTGQSLKKNSNCAPKTNKSEKKVF